MVQGCWEDGGWRRNCVLLRNSLEVRHDESFVDKVSNTFVECDCHVLVTFVIEEFKADGFHKEDTA